MSDKYMQKIKEKSIINSKKNKEPYRKGNSSLLHGSFLNSFPSLNNVNTTVIKPKSQPIYTGRTTGSEGFMLVVTIE